MAEGETFVIDAEQVQDRGVSAFACRCQPLGKNELKISQSCMSAK